MLAGGVSTASTVPATDEEALAHAKAGVAMFAARAAAESEQSKASPASRVVVDGVPVLKTPPEKIRRRDTLPPLMLANEPSAPKHTDPAKAIEDGSEVAGSRTDSGKGTKKKKKHVKKAKKGKSKKKVKAMSPKSGPPAVPSAPAVPSEGNGGAIAAEPVPEAPSGVNEPEVAGGGESNGTEAHAESSLVSGQGNGTPMPAAAGIAGKPEPQDLTSEVDKPKKPAAKKAAPKPKALKVEPPAPAIAKVEAVQSVEALIKRSQSDNLRRATSSIQQTPSACPPIEEDKDDLPPREADDLEPEEDEAEEEEEEEELEAEVEEPAHEASAEKDAKDNKSAGEKTDKSKGSADGDGHKKSSTDEPDKGDEDAGTKKGKARREKTPAEKAVHARYMRFSRSFQSYSDLSWDTGWGVGGWWSTLWSMWYLDCIN